MKKWYEKNITKKDIRDIRQFTHQFGIGLRIKKVLGGGEADFTNGIAFIDPSVKQRREFISMVLHELWHCLCYQQDLYSTYHYKKTPRTKEEIKKFRKVAFRAEVFVDKKAQQMMEVYFPGIPYEKAYRTKEDRQWYYDNYLNKYYSLEG